MPGLRLAIFFHNAASHSSRLANRVTPESLRLAGFYYLPTRYPSSLNRRLQPKCQMLRSDPRAPSNPEAAEKGLALYAEQKALRVGGR